jgi:hypothetical protein
MRTAASELTETKTALGFVVLAKKGTIQYEKIHAEMLQALAREALRRGVPVSELQARFAQTARPDYSTGSNPLAATGGLRLASDDPQRSTLKPRVAGPRCSANHTRSSFHRLGMLPWIVSVVRRILT